MKLFDSRAQCCDADVTKETTVQPRHVYDNEGQFAGTIRAKRIHHYRQRDQAHFWHWSDQEVIQI